MNLTAAAGLRLRKEATNGREEPRYLRQPGDPLVAGARGSRGAPHETRGARRPEHVLAATIRPDERPHIAGVGALWVDGNFYFVSGPGTRKSRNLAKNPNCVISVILSGLDLVVEGTARVVTDEPTLQRLAKLYNAQGWPASVSNGAFTAEYSAPSAGPPPWNLYVMTPSTAFGTASVEPYGATRWRF